MLPTIHLRVRDGTSRWFCNVSRHEFLKGAHVWNAFENGFDQNTADGDAWFCQHEFLLASNTPPSCFRLRFIIASGLRLPWRKLRKIGIMLNLCPSHTEIFSKRRKIYSWLCERLELMRLLLKNAPTSRALGNAFDFDFEFHRWKTIKLRPGEDVRW